MAWAQETKVEPPAHVQAAAPAGWHTVRQRDREACQQCAAHTPKPATPAKAPCCAQPSKEPAKNSAPPTPNDATWVVLKAWHCQGQGGTPLWLSTGAVLPPAPAMTWQPRTAGADWITILDNTSSSFCITPPEPPPRA